MSNVVDGAIVLPFRPSLGVADFSCDINGRTYIFIQRWNGQEKAFYIDILDDATKPIIVGVKVVLGAYLGRMSDHPLFSEGVLIATDLSKGSKEATFDDFGVRVIVQYIPVLEQIYRIRLLYAP